MLSEQLKRKIEAGTPLPAPKKMIRAMKRDQEVTLADGPRRDNEEEEFPGWLPQEEEAGRHCPHCQRLREENKKLQGKIDTFIHRQLIRSYHYCLAQLTRWADQQN